MTQGMPTHIAAGFIAARRGADVRGMYEHEREIADLENQLQDVIRAKMEATE